MVLVFLNFFKTENTEQQSNDKTSQSKISLYNIADHVENSLKSGDLADLLSKGKGNAGTIKIYFPKAESISAGEIVNVEQIYNRLKKERGGMDAEGMNCLADEVNEACKPYGVKPGDFELQAAFRLYLLDRLSQYSALDIDESQLVFISTDAKEINDLKPKGNSYLGILIETGAVRATGPWQLEEDKIKYVPTRTETDKKTPKTETDKKIAAAPKAEKKTDKAPADKKAGKKDDVINKVPKKTEKKEVKDEKKDKKEIKTEPPKTDVKKDDKASKVKTDKKSDADKKKVETKQDVKETGNENKPSDVWISETNDRNKIWEKIIEYDLKYYIFVARNTPTDNPYFVGKDFNIMAKGVNGQYTKYENGSRAFVFGGHVELFVDDFGGNTEKVVEAIKNSISNGLFEKTKMTYSVKVNKLNSTYQIVIDAPAKIENPSQNSSGGQEKKATPQVQQKRAEYKDLTPNEVITDPKKREKFVKEFRALTDNLAAKYRFSMRTNEDGFMPDGFWHFSTMDAVTEAKLSAIYTEFCNGIKQIFETSFPDINKEYLIDVHYDDAKKGAIFRANPLYKQGN